MIEVIVGGLVGVAVLLCVIALSNGKRINKLAERIREVEIVLEIEEGYRRLKQKFEEK